MRLTQLTREYAVSDNIIIFPNQIPTAPDKDDVPSRNPRKRLSKKQRKSHARTVLRRIKNRSPEALLSIFIDGNGFVDLDCTRMNAQDKNLLIDMAKQIVLMEAIENPDDLN